MNSLYETFVCVVESNTLVRAAERLHCTQPTVTRQLQQLESELGVTLFDRLGKRLLLNHRGELVYEHAKRLAALEQKMQDDLNAVADPEVGTVYIGAGLTPSIYFLPPLLASYRRLHPSVRFHIVSGSSREVCAALLHRNIDIGVVTTVDTASGDFDTRPLVTDELLLVCAPNQVPPTSVVQMAQLAHYPMVLMRQGSGLRRLLEDITDEHAVALDVAMETDSLESISRLVQQGVGMSVLPKSSVADDIEFGRLTTLQLDVPLPSRTITMVTRAQTILPAHSAQFWGYLKASNRIENESSKPE